MLEIDFIIVVYLLVIGLDATEVMLYGMVLEKMQKWPELLQLLTTSLGGSFH